MIQGQEAFNREGLIDLRVIERNGSTLEIACVLDTGFSGYLTLHPDEIDALELRFKGDVEIELGNGRIERTATFEGWVDWDGSHTRVTIQESLGSHLLGMHLLSGCTLTMDVTPNGLIAIETEACDPFA